ncbi:hypothetical protein LC612_38430 [Nostoc sp. CHAB 5834]|nr:hypothetical protein [Nostoc sp. CHAB 5834]
MPLPTQDNPDPHRKPDNRQEVFANGEFGDFISLSQSLTPSTFTITKGLTQERSPFHSSS